MISIFKLRKQIKESKKKVEKLKNISDKEVIEHFVNNFEFPLNLVQSTSKNANKIIELLSKLSRNIIKL